MYTFYTWYTLYTFYTFLVGVESIKVNRPVRFCIKITYFRKFRLSMSVWDFRLPRFFRGPSDVFLKKVWKKYLSLCTICPSLSQFEEIVPIFPPTDVLLRFPPTDVLPRTFRYLFKNMQKNIYTSIQNVHFLGK